MIRGIRGATTTPANDAGEIIKSTQLLLEKMIEANHLDKNDVAAVFFSATPDLDQVFPAKAARLLGWHDVPLMCQVEIDVPGALPRCIRIMMLVNTELQQKEIRHVYLGQAKKLRADLFSAGDSSEI